MGDLHFSSYNMAKAIKAMKAMAAMKAMKAMKKKPISAKLARRHVFAGKITKSKGGLNAAAFKKTKTGKIVSKKASARTKAVLGPWTAAVQQGSEHQGICSYQEGHSTLQEGQGALRPVKAMSNLRRASRACSRCGAFYVCRAQEPML